MAGVKVKYDKRFAQKLNSAAYGAAFMAGRDALRSMRAEANRLIREGKAVPTAVLRERLTIETPRKGDVLRWKVRGSGRLMPVANFPHAQTKTAPGRDVKGKFTKGRRFRGGQGGVLVTISTGSRKLIRGAFVAKMTKSGHEGVFRRRGRKSLPIDELWTTRVSTMLGGVAQPVLDKGRAVFEASMKRLLPLEAAKGIAR